MFNKLFSTSACKSNATTAPHLNLFGRAISKVNNTFKVSRIEEKDGLGQGEQNNLPEPSQGGQVHLPQDAHIIEQESTLVSKNAAPPPPPSPATLATSPPRGSPSSTGTPSPTPSVTSTPPTAASSTPSSVRSLQVISELEAAKKKIAELEATITKRRLEHAAYVQKVERMNMPCAIKKLTKERDIFRDRLEPAKREYAQKAAERKLAEQEWKEEEERRVTAQLMVMGAKYGLEESAKQYAELEAKFHELQKQSESDQGVLGAGL